MAIGESDAVIKGNRLKIKNEMFKMSNIVHHSDFYLQWVLWPSYIYIYIYMCVCVCVCPCFFFLISRKPKHLLNNRNLIKMIKR